jgi:pimeloyl-ACP methyl ester carboxylesterase
MAELATDLVVHRHGRPLGDAPTLLLLHGLTDSGEGWPEAVRHWEDQYAIVAVDQRGHGGSPRFTSSQLASHPGEVMVDDAVRLLEQLERPVVIGHSLGGAVALTAGVRRPELVRALVLEDPAPLSPGEPVRGDHGPDYAEGVRASREAPDDEALFRVRKAAHPDWPESELLVTGRAEQQLDLDYLTRGEWKPTTPWPVLFEGVNVPTLVVSGDEVGELCVDETMEKGLERIGNPRVELARVAGAGHCIRRDQPMRYYAAVDEWLSRLLR